MKNRFFLAGGTLAFLASALLLQPVPLAAGQTPAQGATIRGTVTRARPDNRERAVSERGPAAARLSQRAIRW